MTQKFLYKQEWARMFTAALPTKFSNWKQPSGVDKPWYIHTVEYYIATKMNRATFNNIDESHKHNFDKKKPDTKE